VVVVVEAVVEVAEVVVVVAEVVVVVVAEVVVVVVEAVVVVVELRRNNADLNRCHQCLANRLYPNQRPKSEEMWSNHRCRSNECGQCQQTTNQQR
jgi:hypothetical protein